MIILWHIMCELRLLQCRADIQEGDCYLEQTAFRGNGNSKWIPINATPKCMIQNNDCSLSETDTGLLHYHCLVNALLKNMAFVIPKCAICMTEDLLLILGSNRPFAMDQNEILVRFIRCINSCKPILAMTVDYCTAHYWNPDIDIRAKDYPKSHNIWYCCKCGW